MAAALMVVDFQQCKYGHIAKVLYKVMNQCQFYNEIRPLIRKTAFKQSIKPSKELPCK